MNRLQSLINRLIWRRTFNRLVIMLLAMWLVAAVSLRYTEGHANADFDSMPKAYWNIAIYFFSGLDGPQPVTLTGRIIVTLVLVFSVGMVAVFTGIIASFLVESRIGSGRRMPKYNLKDHIVICNWNEKATPIIGQLHARIIKSRRPIVVVSKHTEAGDLPEKDDDPAFEDVFLVRGDPANEIILKRAAVGDAYSVLILADPGEGHLADAKSILIAMAVRAVAGNGRVHICVEGLDPANVQHLRRAGADEIVGASDFAMMLLAQSMLAHGLSIVYRDLLSVTGDTNEIYFHPVPRAFIGKSFEELGAAIFQNNRGENPCILIGAKTEKGILVNPRKHEIDAFSEGDQVIVVALENPDHLL